jgi:hypothetical protein
VFDAILLVCNLKEAEVMELSWPMKFRIGAVCGVGIVLIGILAWPLSGGTDPFSTVLAVNLAAADILSLIGLSVLAGFLCYFIAWPYGREIAILAVPTGLAVWAIRTASMATLIQQKATLANQQAQTIIETVAKRQEIFAAVKWAPLFWLGIIAAGFLGVALAHLIAAGLQNALSKGSTAMPTWRQIFAFGTTEHALAPKSTFSEQSAPSGEGQEGKTSPASRLNFLINPAIGIIGSLLLVQFCIMLLAQDVRFSDSNLGSVVGQPAVGQIVFAVIASFGIAAFVIKVFLNVSYIWPIIASAFVNAYAISLYVNQAVLEHLVKSWPAVFFSKSVLAVLPIQMVSFGCLGAIAGYWLAMQYQHWRQHPGD